MLRLFFVSCFTGFVADRYEAISNRKTSPTWSVLVSKEALDANLALRNPSVLCSTRAGGADRVCGADWSLPDEAPGHPQVSLQRWRQRCRQRERSGNWRFLWDHCWLNR